MQNLRARLISLLLLIAIIALAAYLRLHRAELTPGWYSDEGTHLAIARHLVEGRVQYLAVNESFLLFGRPPLFELLLAAAVKIGGLNMGTLRGLTGLLGTLTVVMMFGVVQALHGRRLALLAAFLLAIYPQAVLYSRFGFSYNLLAPLVLLTLFGLIRYQQTRSSGWLMFTSLGIGIGITADLFAGVLILPLLIVVAYKTLQPSFYERARQAIAPTGHDDVVQTDRRVRTKIQIMFAMSKAVIPPLMLAIGPFALYVLWALATTPDAFLFDLNYTLTRIGGKSLSDQLRDLALNYTVLLSQNFWLLTGLVGLFLLRQSVALLLLILPIAQLGRTVFLHHLSAYYTIPLLPLMALGTAHFLEQAAIFIDQYARPNIGRWLSTGLIIALLGAPFAIMLSVNLEQVNDVYPTSIDPFLLEPAAAQQVAAYINQRALPTDTIIASPGIAWMFAANAADFQMAVAVDGIGTPHIPYDLPANRWAFDTHYEQARYVVVDNLWRNWGVLHNPPVDALAKTVESDWPLVFESGAIQVYENPEHPTSGISDHSSGVVSQNG